MNNLGPSVILRPAVDADLPCFFRQQSDPRARWMAAFALSDPDDLELFLARWRQLLADPTVRVWAIDLDQGTNAGAILVFLGDEGWEVSFWIARAWWGRGVATEAIDQVLRVVAERPLRGRAAEDNVASIKVMQRAGFRIVAGERGFSPVRGEEVDERILVLDR